jgi:diaminopimelate epimerase
MFTRIESPHKITIMPWERGAGATCACGSGAAAATVISTLLGHTSGEVTVSMPGGNLKNRWDIGQNMVFQEGRSRFVFSGIYKS